MPSPRRHPRTAPPQKTVIASQCAHWRGNPSSPRTAFLAPRRGGVLPRPPAPHLLLPPVGRHPCVPPPVHAPHPRALRRGRCPHRPARHPPHLLLCLRRGRRPRRPARRDFLLSVGRGDHTPPPVHAPHLPKKTVIASQCAHWRGNPSSPRTAFLAPRRGGVLPRPPAPHLLLSPVGRHPCVPPPVHAPHPRKKTVIARSAATWQSVIPPAPHSPYTRKKGCPQAALPFP